MNKTSQIGAVTALATLLALPAFVQATLVGNTGLNDRIDAIEEDVNDDIALSNDAERFGPNANADGWTGSLSLGLAATSGNTDTADFSAAGRFRYGAGDWSHTLGFAAEYAKANGVGNKEEIYAVYDANRYFNDKVYGFGLGSVKYDGYASNKWDAFLGVGPGYRVINTPDVAWRVQAGPGVRYSQTQAGVGTTEFAGIASSRLYYKLTDTMFVTNDTDVIFSKSSTIATNDLGVNFKVTDRMNTRVSYRTEYDSAPAAGFGEFDNTFGVSLVYGF